VIRQRDTEQRSLFGEILDWMLAPLLLLWPLSVGLTWVVAQAIANRPYDRELAAVVEALARQSSVQVPEGSHPAVLRRRELERTLAAFNRGSGDDGDGEEGDRTSFQVLGPRGELVAGDPRISVPPADPAAPRGLRYRDDLIGDEPVRVAWLHLPGPRGEEEGQALVQVAETLGKRSRLATEIIKGVILPQFVILPLAVLLVWFALARGVKPLAELQQTIRRRESTDLSAIPVAGVPDEVVPLVGAINELLARLDTSIAAQRHFLADAAHQLKTPLAGLRTQAELAAREIDSGRGDPASMKHSLRQIAVSCQRSARLVNQLLAMARAEDPGQAMRRVPLDLAAITRAVLRDYVPRALERRIDLGYEGPEGPEEGRGPRVVGEPVLLGEVVRNLVDNALQYTPRGGTVTVRVLADPFGDTAVLQVEDTGPGIPPGEREAVFRPFYRALGTEVEGSGLGLAIAQEIVQRHGGEITLGDARPRTSDGSPHPPGALFTVRLPASSA
jgi:two-component system, OmpR family, sensor histidine kinase TctE